MSLLFDRSIPVILIHEGGFSNDKHDTGKATNFGISLRFLEGLKDTDGDGFLDGDINKDGIVNELDAKNLTKDIAIKLYEQYFWNGYYDKIAEPLLSLHLFDMSVNASPKTSTKLIQRLVKVTDDGVFGKDTLLAINKNTKYLVDMYMDSRNNYYKDIVKKNSNYTRFLKGWLNRVKDTNFL